MGSGDTIVARCTARGESGVAMVRLSGERALALGRALFQCRGGLGTQVRLVEFGKILVDGRKVDTGLAWYMQGPQSYTGEDTVELCCHGSMAVVDMIVEEAVRLGARVAEPGEFTRRAFLNGKVDLLEAEGVVELVRAGSRVGVETAYGLAGGGLSRWVGRVRGMVLEVLAHLEVELDFSEEEGERVGREQWARMVENAAGEAERLIAGFAGSRRRVEGFVVALVGRPNVGKSTLLNALVGEDRAIVTEEAGTTRDCVEGVVVWDGRLIRLVDTAGVRVCGGVAEKLGVERALGMVASADVVVIVVDGSEEWGKMDQEVWKMVGGRGDVVAVNKCDLGERVEIPEGVWEGVERVAVSGLRGIGVKALGRVILARLPGESEREAVGLTRERHRGCVERMEGTLRAAAEGLRCGAEEECVAVDLRDAVGAADELLGNRLDDGVLDRIFAEFCVGK